ncbi:MAG: pentapeptide repeat-containing protein [Gallionellaceae bacterium]|jgi:uncharacterized protein YjbI with pentapeptide repeats
MQKFIFAPVSCVVLAVISAMPAFAEDASSIFAAPCAEWKSTAEIDVEALDKLKRSAASEKPASGQSYTKNQFVVLLGKNPVAAKDALANYKDKLPKTREGKVDLRDVTLNGFNLSGFNLDNVDFEDAEMTSVNLSGSTLRGAKLHKTTLDNANLNNTNLSFANASGAKLVNASLCNSTLASVEFEDAVLKGAYLKDAKLDMAKNLPKVIYLNAENLLHFGLPVPEN